jgi:PIN domain nuclease of toxin-antitoxin system
MAGESDRIGARARKAIDGDIGILISAVVIWEIAIELRLGKVDAPADLLGRPDWAWSVATPRYGAMRSRCSGDG